MDAARWYLLSRSHDTTIDLDLDLARAQTSENPVYYVQYAHARIASMLAKAGIARVRRGTRAARRRSRWIPPSAPWSSGYWRSPARLPRQRNVVPRTGSRRTRSQVAQDFTAFYRDCRVVGAEPQALERQRIALCVAARGTIARCLEDLLGVGAPREM